MIRVITNNIIILLTGSNWPSDKTLVLKEASFGYADQWLTLLQSTRNILLQNFFLLNITKFKWNANNLGSLLLKLGVFYVIFLSTNHGKWIHLNVKINKTKHKRSTAIKETQIWHLVCSTQSKMMKTHFLQDSIFRRKKLRRGENVQFHIVKNSKK
jgi:hypothetical protein